MMSEKIAAGQPKKDFDAEVSNINWALVAIQENNALAFFVQASLYRHILSEASDEHSAEIGLLKFAVGLDCPQAMCRLAELYKAMPPSADAEENKTRQREITELYEKAEKLGYDTPEKKEFKKTLQQCFDDAFEHHDFGKFEDLRVLLLSRKEEHADAKAMLIDILKNEESKIQKFIPDPEFIKGLHKLSIDELRQMVRSEKSKKADTKKELVDIVLKQEGKSKLYNPERVNFAKTLLILSHFNSLPLWQNKDEATKVIEYLDEQVSNGDVYAMLVRGLFYRGGRGTEHAAVDNTNAILLFKRAVDEYKCPQAMYLLANIYRERISWMPKKEKARLPEMISLYREAARLGIHDAREALQILERSGIDIHAVSFAQTPEPQIPEFGGHRDRAQKSPSLTRPSKPEDDEDVAPGDSHAELHLADPYFTGTKKPKKVERVSMHELAQATLKELNLKIMHLCVELQTNPKANKDLLSSELFRFINRQYFYPGSAYVERHELVDGGHLGFDSLVRLFDTAEREGARLMKLDKSGKFNALIDDILSKRKGIIVRPVNPTTGQPIIELDPMAPPQPKKPSKKAAAASSEKSPLRAQSLLRQGKEKEESREEEEKSEKKKEKPEKKEKREDKEPKSPRK
jgi:TPR repeat protein